jgi:hypothetical protein
VVFDGQVAGKITTDMIKRRVLTFLDQEEIERETLSVEEHR